MNVRVIINESGLARVSELAEVTRLFDKHNELDQKVKNIESHIEPGSLVDIENLKKEKLALKDQIYAHLKKVEAAQ